jgi:protein O-GlcNAc transferase
MQTAASPDLQQAHTLHTGRQYEAAAEAYRRALAHDPASLDAWYGLGCARLACADYAEAADALRTAVALRPDALGARCSLAEALFQLGALDAAFAEYQQAADSGDQQLRSVALAGMACIAPGCPGQDNFHILAARRRWIDHEARGVRRLTPTPAEPGRKLRIGYLGAYFGSRNWMKMYMGVINAHDRDRCEIHLLADGATPSAECGYIDHADDRIWEIDGVPNETLARHIVEAGLDVLVDLNGYTSQRRLPVFLYRPARLQICWNGMYGTTGIPDIDWLVGDAAVIPPEEERFCCEPVTRVSGTYLPFSVFYPVPDIVPPPCLAGGGVTFGCLASAYKLTGQTLAAYARILHAAPASRLLLRNRTLDLASNLTLLLDRFARLGIGADRLTLEGGAEHFDFLRSYDRIDVALDTFPYNGGTTTAEALWQGVPVLACNGDRWAGRTSRSLLRAAGLEDWVAPDLRGFETAAISLANAADTPRRLAALRTDMRRKLRTSAVCDVTGLARQLEALYRTARDG